MRNADTILAIVRERGKQGLPLERVYRLLFNQELYQRAYARLYPNGGAMTQGSTSETVDGMSLVKIDNLIDTLRYERYQWTPVRRVYIPKSNGKQRPLGIPSWSDKLLQEVIRSIMDAYFDPQFSPLSHGFRPEHGCHTALHQIEQVWTGTVWFIEGDIKQYFDNIDHELLIGMLAEHIHDGRFLKLIRELLAAGYLEDWKFNKTLSGTPQGGVLSPLLSNVYLHKFDQWVETELIPAHTHGQERKRNRAYQRLNNKLYDMRQRGQTVGAKALIQQRRKLPTGNPTDPAYRRLRYVRYADDFLLGYVGTQGEAQEIKRQIKDWLRDNLKLDLSDEKTLITHATTQPARFLGYLITSRIDNNKLSNNRRAINHRIHLRVPAEVVEARCNRYMRNGGIIHRAELLRDSDYDIVARYQQEYRGVMQYYLHANNVGWFNKLYWVMQVSLFKTLAHKHKTSVSDEAQRLKTTTRTPQGKPLRCYEVRVERPGKTPLIARFGGLSLTRQPWAIINDQPLNIPGTQRTELLQRLLADVCELCGSREDVEVHHIRKLKDLGMQGRREKPLWVRMMATRQRKTLVVCRRCHMAIHQGKTT